MMAIPKSATMMLYWDLVNMRHLKCNRDAENAVAKSSASSARSRASAQGSRASARSGVELTATHVSQPAPKHPHALDRECSSRPLTKCRRSGKNDRRDGNAGDAYWTLPYTPGERSELGFRLSSTPRHRRSTQLPAGATTARNTLTPLGPRSQCPGSPAVQGVSVQKKVNRSTPAGRTAS